MEPTPVKEHNHAPNLRLEEERAFVRQLYDRCESRLANTRDIYESLRATYADASRTISWRSQQTNMRRRQQNFIQSLPRVLSLTHLKLCLENDARYDNLTHHSHGSMQLRFRTQNDLGTVAVMGDSELINKFDPNSTMYIGTTNTILPAGLDARETLIIVLLNRNHAFGVSWAFMPDRSEVSFNAALDIACSQIAPLMNPTRIYYDYEQRLNDSLTANIPGATVKGTFLAYANKKNMIKKVIVDCDGGYDDAVSLVLLIDAHKKNIIDLKAITCVAESQALKAAEVRYHGHDGFGDVFTDQVDISKLEKEHAVIAMRKIITENPDQVSVVCLGPLTNVALAVKIYPEILESVKDFFIMGGNSAGQGNTTAQAEFNFYADPESIYILLQCNSKPLWLFPWETCLKSTITMDWRENKLGKLKENKKIKLISTVEDGIYKNKIKREIYRPCDAFCAAALINPKIITHFENCHADIELHGVKTRGFVAIDHLRNNKPNINLVSDLDFQEFKSLMLDSFQE
ncbi:Similar to IUNH: Inosine-uridine preferring nucleoside hydrolase (Crithidia fasciculata) [Cotesia congregata]|uniref:Similar to IUNH: Inosine-uridine preferring nucleoside hydrolase (Crithidia fasciculata) n=1 Tax=Cotesia congregata TaxID=51543 RepID=A0A8J2H508_COTCN|nr:Similar to IUNH: Inosine-uridine preferring nucleoside hydrolase (Crithidia fasciculata) [Cotesia congregata]